MTVKPPDFGGKPYRSLDYHLRDRYGEKIYKVSLDGGMTCPNRDGTLGKCGCIFCSEGGSGDFAGDRTHPIHQQIEEQKARLSPKFPATHFIAYFQAYTNTYAPLSYLERIFTEAIEHEDIVGLSIGTRPDCLPDETLDLLSELNKKKPVTVELGLQTIHERTAAFIRRGYKLSCFEDALEKLRYLNAHHIDGIKLQLLHVLKHTDLADYYGQTGFHILSEDEYVDLVIHCLEVLSPDITIHRLTGDGPSDLLIAPLWSLKKRSVLNHIHHELKVRDTWQGRLFTE